MARVRGDDYHATMFRDPDLVTDGNCERAVNDVPDLFVRMPVLVGEASAATV
jgi:hypothetical protein